MFKFVLPVQLALLFFRNLLLSESAFRLPRWAFQSSESTFWLLLKEWFSSL